MQFWPVDAVSVAERLLVKVNQQYSVLGMCITIAATRAERTYLYVYIWQKRKDKKERKKKKKKAALQKGLTSFQLFAYVGVGGVCVHVAVCIRECVSGVCVCVCV